MRIAAIEIDVAVLEQRNEVLPILKAIGGALAIVGIEFDMETHQATVFVRNKKFKYLGESEAIPIHRAIVRPDEDGTPKLNDLIETALVAPRRRGEFWSIAGVGRRRGLVVISDEVYNMGDDALRAIGGRYAIVGIDAPRHRNEVVLVIADDALREVPQFELMPTYTLNENFEIEEAE